MSSEFTFDYPKFGLVAQSTLEGYATNLLKIPTDIKNRMSWFFLADLYFFHNHKGINPLAVLDEIYILEGLATKPTGTKKESKYTRNHLKGLWHKHYMSARFIPQNIENTLGQEGNGRLTETITRYAHELESSDEEAMYAAAGRMSKEISDSFRMRKNNNKLTGEWCNGLMN